MSKKSERRKLVVDPNLLMSLGGSERSEKRARAQMLADYRDGKVDLSTVYRTSPEATDELAGTTDR